MSGEKLITEEEMSISMEVERSLYEYEEARREHEKSQDKLINALELKRNVIHYYTLLSLLVAVERDGSSITDTMEVTDILAGRQKRMTDKESQDVLIQRMKIENNELKQELQFWKSKNEGNNGSEFIDMEEDSNNSRPSSGGGSSLSLRKNIKFSRRLTSPNKTND